MSAKSKKSPKDEAAATNGADALTGSLAEGEPGNLDKIRTILFGAQSREYEKRFSQLEEMVRRELEAQREALRRRFDELETYIKEEVEALDKRLTAEQKQRKQDLAQAAAERQTMTQTTREALSDLEARLAESERTLRERILTQSKDLSNEMQTQADSLSAMIREAVDLLRTEKTDRLSLADLFEEMSSRLRDDFQLRLDD